jgi:hypothetical protein
MVILPYADYFACDFLIRKYYVWFEHGYGEGYWKNEEVVETVPDECPYYLEQVLSNQSITNEQKPQNL